MDIGYVSVSAAFLPVSHLQNLLHFELYVFHCSGLLEKAGTQVSAFILLESHIVAPHFRSEFTRDLVCRRKGTA